MAKATMIAGCHVEPKALFMSKKTAAYFFSSNPDSKKEMSNDRLYQITCTIITFSTSLARLEIISFMTKLMGL